MNVPFSGFLNYRDVSMTDLAVYDTSLQMCRKSLYDHEKEILSKGMIFNTISEMKLLLQRHSFGPGVEVPRDMKKRLYVEVKCTEETE